ncbi:DNA-3-methyladenine glycosylase I [Brevibacterium sp. 5221]|uniref:DNA-3-methyladenine glycosylase I n=1 Tax=Brevibacterium rongguiense TaxID=2695267 RepID=A0A6N9H620_9MICO|nr:DNA-3-methyladenine glycosylase I [Brevibacterium rongguiense]MYM19064.1 DNA-3-methyladenine glycosylase I [Brevibacterium rongguiense]
MEKTADQTQQPGRPLGAVTGDDGRARTPWAYGHPLLFEYYDTEWGEPVEDEAGMFERVVLEGAQAGLSWLTILKKRPRYRQVFADFDVDAVAAFDAAKIDELLADPGIIRNRGKVESAVNNARRTIELRADGGLVAFIESFAPAVSPEPRTVAEIPTVSAESTALSKALRARSFRFVGPTTMHALLEATGLIDTHLMDSWRRGVSGRFPR